MYLAVDVGGTKTLIAAFSDEGEPTNVSQFETPKKYRDFVEQFETNLKQMGFFEFHGGAVAIPGRVDREEGVGLSFGNLDWKKVPIQDDLERIVKIPIKVENDAKLAGLSEAINIKNEFNRVLYITVSTGVGAAFIMDGVISEELEDMEAGHMLLEHNGKLVKWESFASGKAIVRQFGKKAMDIDNESDWKMIARNLSLGIIDLIAVVQPEVIVFGGSVGVYFDRFRDHLLHYLKSYETPMTPIPELRKAQQPEEAVIYGCYQLMRQKHAIHAH